MAIPKLDMGKITNTSDWGKDLMSTAEAKIMRDTGLMGASSPGPKTSVGLDHSHFADAYRSLFEGTMAGNKEPSGYDAPNHTRILENILAADDDQHSATLKCVQVKVAGASFIIAIAVHPDGNAITAIDAETNFPSPAMLTKLRLFQ